MTIGLRRLASNAAANVANGAASAGFQLCMTGLMARTGQARDLAVWSLAASLASLAPLLGCNLSTAVARRLAGVGGIERRPDAVMAAASSLSRRLALIGGGVGLSMAVAVPFVYPRIVEPHPIAAAATVLFFFVGSSWVVSAQAAQGWLLDRHRNWPYAGAGLAGRTLALVLALVALLAGLPAWAMVFAASAALWLAMPMLRRAVPMPTRHVEPAALAAEGRALFGIALGFAIWAAVSAAIQGATVPLVAWLAPHQAAPFFLAFTLVTVVVGAVMAAANALVAPIAGLLARGDRGGANRVAIRACVITWSGFNFTMVMLYLLLAPLLHAWTGAAHVDATQVRPYLAWLALQHGIRSTAIVPSIVLATGAEPATMLRSALPEALVAVLVGLPLGLHYGPIGLLAGLVAAAATGSIAVGWISSHHVLDRPSRSAVASLPRLVAALATVTALGWAGAAWWGTMR
ncbi:MAG: hypothetical protein KGJ30_00800 [Burkholderiales bacterium]|nr:hypothetical protein [Burkholderiales bacterium]MDE1925912.1 hypothetical protein [Burkholderiales bacterium]MDE2157429.1 hypothetical protein [Burkholderiales bacterium]